MAKENDHQKRRGVKSNAKGWDDGEKRGQDEGTTRTPIRGSFRGRVNRMRVSLLHHLRSRISIRAWERRRERQRLCNGGRCRHGTPNSFNFSAITFGITMLAAVILNLVLRVPRVLGDGASMLLSARGGVDLEGRESPATLGSDIGIFLDNDLEGENSPRADSGVLILHGDRDYKTSKHACELLNEKVWSPATGDLTSMKRILAYLSIIGGRPKDLDLFWIDSPGIPRALDSRDMNHPQQMAGNEKYPVICTNTAPFSTAEKADTSKKWQIVVDSNHQLLVGYRDRRSFVFKGIAYAEKPERWLHSKVKQGSSNNRTKVMATEYGQWCAQKKDGKVVGAEDCLTLNIWTPHLPHKGFKTRTQIALKPVMLWVHGGSFVAGSGTDTTFDGGNLASRGDVVVVTFNYRLGNLGFLALEENSHQQIFGNYALSDLVTALNWVRDHIHDFGGNKDKITVAGQSAGASLVRALLASKKAEGKFERAILMAGLGGSAEPAKSYSVYKTVRQSAQDAGNRILRSTLCSQKERSRNSCLRSFKTSEIVSWSPEAQWLVRDNELLSSNQLLFTNEARKWQPGLMLGYMRDDIAAQLKPPLPNEDMDKYFDRNSVQRLYETVKWHYPKSPHANITEATFATASLIATDLRLRCSNWATAQAAVMTRTFNSSGVYFCEFHRSYPLKDYPKSPGIHKFCSAPKSDSYPLGNPELEGASEAGYRCHSGELYYVFGNLAFHGLPDRDGKDYDFSRQVLDAWAAFVWRGEPNWDFHYLTHRGYESSVRHLNAQGRWEGVRERLEGTGWEGMQGRVVRRLGYRSANVEGGRVSQRCRAVGLGGYYWLEEREDEAKF